VARQQEGNVISFHLFLLFLLGIMISLKKDCLPAKLLVFCFSEVEASCGFIAHSGTYCTSQDKVLHQYNFTAALVNFHYCCTVVVVFAVVFSKFT